MQNKIRHLFSPSSPPTPEEVKKYLEGSLSAEERQQLEKRLESSELYTEGMEGLELIEDADTFADLTNTLHQEIDERTAPEKQNRYIGLWAVAASLVLVCGITIIIFKFQSHRSNIGLNKETTSGDQTLIALDAPSPRAQSIPEDNLDNVIQLNQDRPAPTIQRDSEVEESATMDYNRAPTSEIPINSLPAAEMEMSAVTDYREIFQDMLAFAEVQAKSQQQDEENKDMGYSEKKSIAMARKTRVSKAPVDMPGSKSEENFSTMPKPIEDKASDISTAKEEPALSYFLSTDSLVQQQKITEVLQRIQKGNYGSAELLLDGVINQNDQAPELGLWIKAMLLLKKGQKEDATIVLKKLENSNSAFSTQSRKVLDRL